MPPVTAAKLTTSTCPLFCFLRRSQTVTTWRAMLEARRAASSTAGLMVQQVTQCPHRCPHSRPHRCPHARPRRCTPATLLPTPPRRRRRRRSCTIPLHPTVLQLTPPYRRGPITTACHPPSLRRRRAVVVLRGFPIPKGRGSLRSSCVNDLSKSREKRDFCVIVPRSGEACSVGCPSFPLLVVSNSCCGFLEFVLLHCPVKWSLVCTRFAMHHMLPACEHTLSNSTLLPQLWCVVAYRATSECSSPPVRI